MWIKTRQNWQRNKKFTITAGYVQALSQQLIDRKLPNVWKNSTTALTNRVELTFNEHSTQQEQNTHSFQVSMVRILKVDHNMSHKINLNIFKRIEITPSVFFNHNEISNRKIMGKFPNAWKLNNILLNNPWVKEEVWREIKKHIEMNENITY